MENENMGQESSSQIIKESCLRIVEDIDRVCRENKIDYSLCAGSVIGAHLYGGFIPWDDDIDLMMTRENYERFCRLYPSYAGRGLHLHNYREDGAENTPFLFSRVEDLETLVTEQIAGSLRKGRVFVDITVYDRLGSRFGELSAQLLNALTFACLYRYNGMTPGTGYKRLLYQIFAPKLSKKALEGLYASFDGFCRGLNRSGARRCAELLSARFSGIRYESRIFDAYRRIPFEGLELMVVEDYMDYLEMRYHRREFVKEKRPEILQESHIRKVSRGALPEISVIVPVYNTPLSFVERAVKSLEAPSKIVRGEVLLIDDGSREEIAKGLLEIAEKYSGEGNPLPVRYVRQENMGVSGARNAGIHLAEKDYVAFLDADDRMLPGALDEISLLLSDEAPDLLIGQITRSGGRRKVHFGEGDVSAADQQELMCALSRYYMAFDDPAFKGKGGWVNRAPHARFIKRGLIREVPFPKGIDFGEDVLWNYRLLEKLAKRGGKLLFVSAPLYCYHENAFAATQAYRSDFPGEVHLLLKQLKSVAHRFDLPSKVYYQSVLEYFTVLMRVYVFGGERSSSRARFDEEMKNPIWQEAFWGCDLPALPAKLQAVALAGRLRAYEGIYRLFALHHRGRGMKEQ